MVPGVPVIYLHGKAPTLDSPSEASRKYAEAKHKDLGMTTWEKENVKILRKQAGLEEKSKIRKKKKGGPNPLSCLKKKKKPETVILNKNDIKSGKVRKRKIKIASHIKEALLTELKREYKT